MKALVKLRAEPGIWMEEVDEPSLNPNHVLIKIHKTAICGTDMHIYHWNDWAQKTVPVPMVIGHEFSGEIAAIGSNVQGLAIGNRVSGEGHLTCGVCRNCRAGRRHICRNTIGIGYDRPGCFAEYFVMPKENVFLLPDDISDDLASILDPFGNATHTTLKYDLVGEDVLITGAGPLGIMATAIAKHVGARHIVITDSNEYRLRLAKQMGATRTVNITRETLPEVMDELGMQEGFDVGLEMSGNGNAINDMIEVMIHGGKVAMLGLLPDGTGINWHHVVFKMLTVQGIYGREIFETWYKMISMLQSGLDLTPMITHHFAIDDYQEAFATMASGLSGKVILNWE